MSIVPCRGQVPAIHYNELDWAQHRQSQYLLPFGGKVLPRRHEEDFNPPICICIQAQFAAEDNDRNCLLGPNCRLPHVLRTLREPQVGRRSPDHPANHEDDVKIIPRFTSHIPSVLVVLHVQAVRASLAEISLRCAFAFGAATLIPRPADQASRFVQPVPPLPQALAPRSECQAVQGFP